MRFNLFGRSSVSKPTPQSSKMQRKVRDHPGPLTACEAWSIAKPAAKELDPNAALTFITSGLDMSPEGRSFTWEFLLILPTRGERALISLEPSNETEEIDHAPIMMAQRLNPISAAESSRVLILPELFRDSPDVIAEFASQGVDFVAGPTDMKLETKVLPTGECVWVTYYWDVERRTRFAH